ncbi:aldehyde dehydrogenase family protein [Streptomyces tsukubensis]|uniref:Aldehyde dehydrogenase n=1 Tax=Streptomyces tsukubensis TaxID=83656 RepID=A0A1V4A543_9ACTN|nr:aldehyde dehydrogenase family protein [Streptomyces tsukubensis]OON75348.1 aldehyde dehydrogenase [Streptomyces tsukubensis]QFR95022.1 aldehyde dehydrogenase family protein [Streptomyces tsukubensis]
MSFFTELAHQYIDGEWRTGRGSWDIIDFNPHNGEKLASMTIATAEEVDEAYRAAERAQPAWEAAGAHARQRVLERALRVTQSMGDEIAAAIVQELGGTWEKARNEVSVAEDLLREASRIAIRPEGTILPSLTPGKENRLYRKPVGVVGVICPFNFPLLVALRSVAPALALGNAVVVKPNQNSPVVGGGLLARIFSEAGLPPGLLNIVVTDIAEIGDVLVEHPVPKLISFSGSDRVGRHIAALAATHFKRVVLQLSGNSALVVLDDLDAEGIDYAVDAAVFSRYMYQGQVCVSANRILVDRAVEAEFTAKFVARVEALRTGDPSDPESDLGPVISEFHAEALNTLVDQAVEDGATALVRGRTKGNLVEPTVLTGVPDGSPLLHQEIFGPIALIIPFDGEEEAVRIANDTPYGLSGAVHTANTERGVEFARRIETGMMHVNGATIQDEPLAPFGGEKFSGAGRLGGEATVQTFTTEKWISVQHGRPGFPL